MSRHNIIIGTTPSQVLSETGIVGTTRVPKRFSKHLRELTILTGKYSKREMRTGVFEYIETYYNRRRRHSALGYAMPLAYITNRVV